MNQVIAVITLVSIALIIYHHALFPVLLKWLARRRLVAAKGDMSATPKAHDDASTLASISLIVPAYNESAWIADKIRNLASLNYPSDKLTVHIGFDGCTDDSAAIARQTLQEPLCALLNCQLHEFSDNRGKVAVLNQLIAQCDSQLVGLSDTSALLSIDALLLGGSHFTDPQVGIVNSHYLLLTPTDAGETKYWQYQNTIKNLEASMGSPMGTHGAFYLFRRELFSALASDTINDDFILPMSIVAQGYLGVQDNRIHALEQEGSTQEQNFARRRRIGAGNMQQIIRLSHLLWPAKHGRISFIFWSGKTLRVACSYLMLLALLGSLYLAPSSMLFAGLAALQLSCYGVAILGLCAPKLQKYAAIQAMSYLVSGHFAIFIGSLRYLCGLEQGRWQKVSASTREKSQ